LEVHSLLAWTKFVTCPIVPRDVRVCLLCQGKLCPIIYSINSSGFVNYHAMVITFAYCIALSAMFGNTL
jgi:hypothetical protein